jgi:membrane peptidoglycan carboxypeptidase
MDVGLKEVVSAARDLGIDARLSAVPSLALGAAEVSLLDLTGAFASVRAGRMLQPWGIAAFGAENQSTLRSTGPPVSGSGQTLGSAQQPMIELLRLVVERGTGRAASLDGFAAGKTGTSQNHRDAWFVGFNEGLVVGVWVGNDDGSPMEKVVGGTLPASIWKRFMTEAAPLVGRETPRIADLQGPEMNAFARETSTGSVARGRCDYRACASAYRSFRPSDCTYHSYSGERKVCEMRPRPSEASAPSDTNETSEHARNPQVPRAASDPPQDAQQENGPRLDSRPANAAQAQCNVHACARRYRSFNASDCTYKPYDRRQRALCEIGAQSATSPPQRAPSATERADQSSDRMPERTEGRAGPPREQPRALFRWF